MLVENSLDELRVGVKGQSNLVIARSPRNAFRSSLGRLALVVENWMDYGAYQLTESNQTANASDAYPGSETVGAKLHRRKGNSPDYRLRSQTLC